jgi:site-specific DNA recombinase
MDKLLDLHLAGEIPKEGFGKRYNPLDEQLKQIERSMPVLQAEMDFLKIEALNGDHLFHEAKTLCDHWPNLPLEGKRTIVEQVTSSIVIGAEDIKIRMSYNPILSGNEPDSQRNFRGSCLPPT